jgi:AcrR family transcriptional regulator
MKSGSISKPRTYAQTVRAEAAEATGQRIVDAFIARLMGQWFDEITLDAVAADADVTVQTVIRRFGGKEGLLAAAVKVVGQQINARRAAPSGDIDRLIHNLVEDYEKTGDPVLRLLALETRHAALKQVTDFGRSEHRRWVAAAFGDSLGKLDAKTEERSIDMLVIATDVYTWKLLRRDMKRGITETQQTIKKMISNIIAGV